MMPEPTSPPASSSNGRGLRGLLRGLTYPLSGTVMLGRNRSLWSRAVLPMILMALLLAGSGALALSVSDTVQVWLTPGFAALWTGWKARVVAAAVSVVTFSLLSLSCVIGTFLLGSALMGPIFELLSERAEALHIGEVPDDPPFALGRMVRDSVGSIVSALGRMLLFAAVYVPLLGGSLLPGIGIVFVLATIVYSSFFLALNFIGPALDRRSWGLRDRLRWARLNLGAVLGFGFAIEAISLLPGAAIVLTPALVVAGTLLWSDCRQKPVELL